MSSEHLSFKPIAKQHGIWAWKRETEFIKDWARPSATVRKFTVVVDFWYWRPKVFWSPLTRRTQTLVKTLSYMSACVLPGCWLCLVWVSISWCFKSGALDSERRQTLQWWLGGIFFSSKQLPNHSNFSYFFCIRWWCAQNCAWCNKGQTRDDMDF